MASWGSARMFRWYATHVQYRDTAFSRAFRRFLVLPYFKLACGRGTGFYRADHPQLEEIAQHHRTIRDECLALVRDGGLEVFRELLVNPERKWKQFRFFSTQRPDIVEAGRRRLPFTTAIFARCLTGLEVGATVTVLEPGGRILPHADLGVAPRFLRFHFGVDIPPRCVIRCAGESTTWNEGGWIALDERKLHSCFNGGDRPRIVIALDLAVPPHLRVAARLGRRPAS